jgi:hypothetical protein
MDNPYELALLVQDASNLSGVGHDFSRLIGLVRAEYERENNNAIAPTAWVAQHPAVYLYVCKMAEMVGIFPSDNGVAYGKAYDTCKQRSQSARVGA